MFGFLKKKENPFADKHYTFQYHHVCMGDGLKFECTCRSWVDAVNKLSDFEKGQWFFIDYVDVKEFR